MPTIRMHARSARAPEPTRRTHQGSASDIHHTVASCLALRIHAQDTRVYLATMSGQLETVKKIEPIYKSPDKWDTHLAMHVKRGMQGSWSGPRLDSSILRTELLMLLRSG